MIDDRIYDVENVTALEYEAKKAVAQAQAQWIHERSQIRYNKFIKPHHYPIKLEWE